MKCKGCGHRVYCAHCGDAAESPQETLYLRRKALGVCVRCAVDLTPKDAAQHAHCRTCRLKENEKSRRRHQVKGRKRSDAA